LAYIGFMQAMFQASARSPFLRHVLLMARSCMHAEVLPSGPVITAATSRALQWPKGPRADFPFTDLKF